MDNSKIIRRALALSMYDIETAKRLKNLEDTKEADMSKVIRYVEQEFGVCQHSILDIAVAMCNLGYIEDAKLIGVQEDAGKLIKQISEKLRARNVFSLGDWYSHIVNKSNLDMRAESVGELVDSMDLKKVCGILTGYLKSSGQQYDGIQFDGTKLIYNYSELDVDLSKYDYIDFLNGGLVEKGTNKLVRFEDIDRK